MPGLGRYASRSCDTPDEDAALNTDDNGHASSYSWRSRYTPTYVERHDAVETPVTPDHLNAIATFAVDCGYVPLAGAQPLARTLLRAYRSSPSCSAWTALYMSFRRVELPMPEFRAAVITLHVALNDCEFIADATARTVLDNILAAVAPLTP